MDWIRSGALIRVLRVRGRLRQADLGRRAGVSRDVVSSIERGRPDEFSAAQLDRVAAALGATVDLRIRWHGEQLDRLLDEAHAATVAAIVRRLVSLGWETAIGVSFSIWGERGSIDVLGWHPATRTVLVVEVKSVIPDLQALLHGLDRKARLASSIAEERGWPAVAIGRLVVVAESPTSRGRVRRHAAILDVALPAQGAAIRTWLRAPSGPIAGLVFLSNASPGRRSDSIWRRQRVRRPLNRGSRPLAAIDNESSTEAALAPDAPE